MLRKSAYEEASAVAIGEDSTLLWMAHSMDCKGVPTEEAAADVAVSRHRSWTFH